VSAPLYGLVLSGGHSRRFGADKAAIDIRGRALLARTVALLEPVTEFVFVSVRADQSDDELRSAYPLIVDDKPGLGPAAGLLAAHRRHESAAWLIVACDMPELDEATVTDLVQSRNADRDATAYRSPVDGEAEPLCAIYEPATLARFAHTAAEGPGLSPRRLLNDGDVEYVALARPRALRNVNALEDL
jgi:molybdopterin-guanine dinucleotide biosynthesis protein A